MYCAIVWFVFSEFGLLKLFLLYYVPGSQCGRATSGIWALLLTPKPRLFFDRPHWTRAWTKPYSKIRRVSRD